MSYHLRIQEFVPYQLILNENGRLASKDGVKIDLKTEVDVQNSELMVMFCSEFGSVSFKVARR